MDLKAEVDRIPGWCSPDLVDVLFDIHAAQVAAGVHGHLLEIGVHHGRSFVPLRAMARDGEVSVAVDLFDWSDFRDQATRADLEANVVRVFGSTDGVLVHQGDSHDLKPADLMAMAGGRFRIVSVDGAHDLEGALADLRLARSVSTRDTAIVVDDWNSPGWPEVPLAIVKFERESPNWGLWAVRHNRAILVRRDSSVDWKGIA